MLVRLSFNLLKDVVDLFSLLHSTQKLLVQIIASRWTGYITSAHKFTFNLLIYISVIVEEVRPFSFSFFFMELAPTYIAAHVLELTARKI